MGCLVSMLVLYHSHASIGVPPCSESFYQLVSTGPRVPSLPRAYRCRSAQAQRLPHNELRARPHSQLRARLHQHLLGGAHHHHARGLHTQRPRSLEHVVYRLACIVEWRVSGGGELRVSSQRRWGSSRAHGMFRPGKIRVANWLWWTMRREITSSAIANFTSSRPIEHLPLPPLRHRTRTTTKRNHV